MSMSNYERVGKALGLVKDGLRPFVEREMQAQFHDAWEDEIGAMLADSRLGGGRGDALQDVAVQLVTMDRHWGAVFRKTLGKAERSLVNELLDVRNRWAHQNPFSGDDADRALDSMARLLTAVSAPEADEVTKMKLELRRLIFDEQVRQEKRRAGGSLIEAATTGAIKPWREVVTPHPDVASGRYQQAEFAADLWQVHLGQGADEYRDPVEFFRRTYLTESLRQILVSGVQRLSGGGGDPVVQLQTNFGGGKTHSMLALYHLFSGTSPAELAGIDTVMKEAGVASVPTARRVVLVGNKISPGNPSIKPDGTVVRTLWGELAWQLGGKKAFQRIKADDENATSPGDVLRELFKDYGPCLILIDEWVAYARQLHEQSDLPAGSFETQFSFAQVLTESAKLAENCLLVVSLPASDTGTSPHAQADDVEVGGQRGREALARLQNVVGRLEASWRPASAEEGFEIVRRRLFQSIGGPDQFKDRDVTARSFGDLYRTQQNEFPTECRNAEYEKRIKAAYPIHPEIFDRLYTDWSTLVKFQRTRGVLRLMAAVIHSLWEKGDQSALIMPASIPIDDSRVQSELTRYLSDNWVPVIEKDVDGPGSLPLRLDGDLPNLGKFSACRRVARTIYLGSAPLTRAAHRGVEDRQVRLGCVMPGEPPAVFGDALRRLSNAATYLYQDGSRYWYSTQPTVTKMAEDRAEQLKREPDKVAHEIDKRLRADLRTTGDFERVHVLTFAKEEVADRPEAGLVVLSIDHAYSKDSDCPAIKAATVLFESRGNSPRIYRNTLVFLAADRTRLQDLDEAVRKYLAWTSILDEEEQLNLDPQQVKQAEAQLRGADGAVSARIPETYQWLIVPGQSSPQAPIEWQAIRVTGTEALATRASRKLRNEELLLTGLAPSRLRMELDRIPLWPNNHVAVRQLVEYFATYLYLPRLQSSGVLHASVQSGLALLTWQQDSFALADSFDESEGRYRGLRAGQQELILGADSPGLLVKPEVAKKQIDAEGAAAGVASAIPHSEGVTPSAGGEVSGPGSDENQPEPAVVLARRFHGTVGLDQTRVGIHAAKIADEVIAHLVGLVGAKVRVTLEIEAEIPSGAPDHVVRTVTENGRTLKFTSQGFESE